MSLNLTWEFTLLRFSTPNLVPPPSNISFPIASHNQYYNATRRNLHVTELFRIYPTVLVSSNTGDRPVPHPPPYSPPTALDASLVSIGSRYDTPVLIQPTPTDESWLAFMHEPHRVLPGEVMGGQDDKGPVRWSITGPTWQNLKSRIDELRGKRFTFLSELHKLHILAPQLTQGGNSIPHLLIYRVNAILEEIPLINRIFKQFSTSEGALQHLQAIEDDIAIVKGYMDMALLHSLDVSAFVGGCHLAVWSAQSHWRGMSVHKRCFDSIHKGPEEDEFMTQRTLRTFERWGGSIWCFVYNSVGQRLDLSPDSMPTGDVQEEARHQSFLQTQIKARGHQPSDTFHIVGRVETRQPNVGEGRLPIGPLRDQLESAVLNLLDPSRDVLISFGEFSAIAESILPPGVWKGTPHEASLHLPLPLIGERERWTKVRDQYLAVGHLGYLYAAFEVPPSRYNPDLTARDMQGNIVLSRTNNQVDYVPLRKWFVAELDDFPERGDAMEEVRRDAMQ